MEEHGSVETETNWFVAWRKIVISGTKTLSGSHPETSVCLAKPLPRLPVTVRVASILHLGCQAKAVFILCCHSSAARWCTVFSVGLFPLSRCFKRPRGEIKQNSTHRNPPLFPRQPSHISTPGEPARDVSSHKNERKSLLLLFFMTTLQTSPLYSAQS